MTTEVILKGSMDHLLPTPKHPIPIDFDGILQAFQHVGYMGELKQRWFEIKKLQATPLPIPLTA